MIVTKTKLGVRLAIIYSALVVTSLLVGFAGQQSPFFLLAALSLTLPWSFGLLDSYGFSLAHGALDYGVAWYFAAFAAVNASIIYFIGRLIERWRA